MLDDYIFEVWAYKYANSFVDKMLTIFMDSIDLPDVSLEWCVIAMQDIQLRNLESYLLNKYWPVFIKYCLDRLGRLISLLAEDREKQ